MQPVRLGNNELLIRLASGGAANVFLVRDLSAPRQDRLLALKILLPSLASNEDFLNMFFTEARIASRLRHDNVVSITGFGQVEGIHCLAMEYVFGASLAQVLRASARAKKPLTVGVLLRITAAVCDALHFAHETQDEKGESMSLVHRDVTPQNILIGFNGIPKLTDFGIAKATGRGWETQAGIVKGKFSYMSPEQALGKKVDRRSDIFGTGIVLWEALTGRDLFRGTTPMEVLTAIREQKIEPPSKVVPGLTPIVDPIVMKALRRSPRQRYASSAEMRDDILDLIRRAGVEIDAGTISKEFYAIYGEEIGNRAVELRKAMAGKADVEALARTLGGQALSPKHLPVIPGGVTDPDPLGLFSDRVTPSQPPLVDRVTPSQPPPLVAPPPQPAETRTDFQVVESVPDGPPEPPEASGSEETGPTTAWNQGRMGEGEQDDLLAMLSEEDATIGLLPKEFAARFGARLEEAREAEHQEAEGFEDDEVTTGNPEGGGISRIRSLADPDSHNSWDQAPAYAQPEAGHDEAVAGSASSASSLSAHRGSGEYRPVPRAPSLDIGDSEPDDATRPFVRPKGLDDIEVIAGRPERPPGPNPNGRFDAPPLYREVSSRTDPISNGSHGGVARAETPTASSPPPPSMSGLSGLHPARNELSRSNPRIPPAGGERPSGPGLRLSWPALAVMALLLLAAGFAVGALIS